ncbi:MAG: hypothetical protein IH606_12060 [Burkholderiales bacterium]|nr:hypothetical protein [Burkholderiales bacterium]
MRKLKTAVLLIAALHGANAWAASSDEIQVYDDAISDPGEADMDVHINYVPSGIKTPAYPGEIPAHHNFRITPEFAYGLNKNWDAGLYLPIIREGGGDWHAEGMKLRLKYMADHSTVGFYWGLNGELGYSSHRTEEQHWNFELRPILGYKNKDWNLTLNPIFGTALSGSDHTPGFSPAVKISRRVTEKTWISIEHYADYGPTNALRSLTQETYLTTDTEVFGHALNIGFGRGWTKDSNDWTLKAIVNVPF